MKKIGLILISAFLIIITGSVGCSCLPVYAADSVVDINVSSSGGGKRKHHSDDVEMTEKEKEIELSRANIAHQEEELKKMQAAQAYQAPQTENAVITPVVQENTESEAVIKPEKSAASKKESQKSSEEPKTAGTDIPIVPIAFLLLLTDMLIVTVESLGDFDDYIRREHIEKLVEKYNKGGRLNRITARIEISLCMFYSRWRARSGWSMNSSNKA